ncbi:unnamed protein product [Symbiodinium sp. CCMP2592]|nr:unnamed protein product [Symbiodinium sp. CCMP2592]
MPVRGDPDNLLVGRHLDLPLDDLAASLRQASADRFDFVSIPLAAQNGQGVGHEFRPSVESCLSLEGDKWRTAVVGRVSESLDLDCSPQTEELRLQLETELRWASKTLSAQNSVMIGLGQPTRQMADVCQQQEALRCLCGSQRVWIEQDVEAAVPGGSSSTVHSKTAQSGWDIAELASGPHLRGIVMVVSLAFWFAARTWLPQISMLPFVMLCTASTSALWCTPEGVVVSLGPVPLCIFRRRIPYRDITSIVVVRGRKSVAVAMAKHLFRLWQPFGYVYALTLGKDVVDIRLHHCKEKESADDISSAPAGSWLPWLRCSPCTLLVSVDKADDVVAHVQFRSEHGPLVPLPHALRGCEVKATAAKWVVCDIFEMLLSWHARNRVACDACSLLLQPFQEANQSYAWAARSRTA